MFSFELTPEQDQIQDAVREFAEREVRPFATRADRLQDAHRDIPWRLLEEASRMGLRALGLSEARGGAGVDCVTACIVLEELAAGDPSVAATLGQTGLLARVLFDEIMTDRERARWLQPFLDDDRSHICFAGHEAALDYGWSYQRPLTARRAVDTIAEPQADGSWIVNGLSSYAANAELARLVLLEARSPGIAGTGLFVLSRDTPGVQLVEDPPDGSFERWHHTYAGRLAFVKCRLEPQQRLTDANGPGRLREAFLRYGEPQQGAISLGIGRAALDAAVAYAKLRRQGGRQIIEHQAIGTMLGDSAMRLEIARNTVWKAAWCADRKAADDPSGLPVGTIARVCAAEYVVEVTERSAECFGAMGVMRDMSMQKHVHDALVSLHSGRNAGARLRVAEAVAGYRRDDQP